MTTVPLPQISYYARTLTAYFGYSSESERLAYWNSFVEANGYTISSPPVDSPQLQQQFDAFLQQYKAWGITPYALSLGNSIPASNPYYSQLLTSYFPSSSPSTLNDIWNSFLASEHSTATPPDTASVREAFAAYVKILTTSSISNTLNEYFGTFSESFRIQLWERFAQSQGMDVLVPPDTSAVQAAFRQFVQRYVALGITEEDMLMTNPIPSSPSFYQNFMNGFFGNLSNGERQDIWNNFLSLKGLTSNPPDSPQLQQAFASYMASTASRLIDYEETTSLSPSDVQARVLMSSVLSALLQFLNAIQNTVQLQSSSLIFYGQEQQNYTEMMARVPNLSSGAQPKVKVNTNDLSQFTFGYDSISMQDVMKWGISQATLSPGQTYTFGNTSPTTTPNGYSYLIGQYSFTVNTSPAGVQTLTITAAENSSGVNVSKDIVMKDLTNLTNPVNLSFDDMVSAATTQYQQIFTSNPSFTSALANGPGGIPGRYLGITNPVGDAQINANTQQIQMRSEVNSRLQLVVQNIQTLRDSLTTTMNQGQSLLTQTRQSIDNQSNLLTDILESINTIIKAINK